MTYRHETDPTVLRNLNNAMELNPYGKPVLRVQEDTAEKTSKNRLKVSDYEVINFNTYQYDKEDSIWDEQITGDADAILDTDNSWLDMRVGPNLGDKIIRQTKRVLPYVPGRPNEVTSALRFGPLTPGIRRRNGPFTETSGCFFEDDGTNYYAVVRKTVDGITTDTRVSRDQWNGDRLTGTGDAETNSSGVEADPLAIQLFLIEYEWYGAGQVIFKYLIDGNVHTVHTFNHGNNLESPWTSSPFLPIRTELENVTGVAGNHFLNMSSSSVLAEGKTFVSGIKHTVGTDIGGITAADADVFNPIISFRLAADRLDGVAIAKEFQAVTLDNSSIYYRVYLGSQLTGANVWTSYENTHVEYNTDATAITDGSIVDEGFINQQSSGFKIDISTFDTQFSRSNLGTTGDIITIAIAPATNNVDVYANFSWIEVR